MLLVAAAFFMGVKHANAAGTLKPVVSTDQALQVQSHEISVVINNGFARTEVAQTFYNPNGHAIEGLYSFPVPKNASLADVE